MPTPLSEQSQSFSAIASAIKARILAGAIGASTLNTYIICAPDDRMAEHIGEPGYRIRVSPPSPSPMTGAGRGGLLFYRRVDIFIISENLEDTGGLDEKAVLAHLALEDAIVNVLTLTPPTTLPYGTTITLVGDLIQPTSGDTPIGRKLKENPGLLVSTIPFIVQYVAPVNVNRV